MIDLQCICPGLYGALRCPKPATQEDRLCDRCRGPRARGPRARGQRTCELPPDHPDREVYWARVGRRDPALGD